MNITFPTDTTDVIDAIRGVIGRDITFVTVSSIPCSACSLDPITDTSTNSFCLVCSGEGYIDTEIETTVSGHITHNPAETMMWASAGKYPDGDIRAQVKYTVANIDLVDNSIYVRIDGDKYDIRSRIYRGVKELNRILVDLIQRQN